MKTDTLKKEISRYGYICPYFSGRSIIMAGFIAKGNNEYIGTLKLATGEADIYNGMFVSAVSWSAGTAATPNANTQVAYFVENVIDTVDEQQINDLNFVITAGQYIRMKKLLPGEIFVTTKVVGTPSVGDTLDVGTTGKITATSGSPNQTFTVIEKPTLWGTTAYKCVVNN